jgi:hypothetical protein
MRDERCKEIANKVQWVKGHTDHDGRELKRDEYLNMGADLIADEIHTKS